MEDRLIELEALQKALNEGTGLYNLQSPQSFAYKNSFFAYLIETEGPWSLILLQKPMIKCKPNLLRQRKAWPKS